MADKPDSDAVFVPADRVLRRIDAKGRDVTNTPRLWDESDRMDWVEQPPATPPETSEYHEALPSLPEVNSRSNVPEMSGAVHQGGRRVCHAGPAEPAGVPDGRAETAEELTPPETSGEMCPKWDAASGKFADWNPVGTFEVAQSPATLPDTSGETSVERMFCGSEGCAGVDVCDQSARIRELEQQLAALTAKSDAPCPQCGSHAPRHITGGVDCIAIVELLGSVNGLGEQLGAVTEKADARICQSCFEIHPLSSSCPPHEARTTGQAWFHEQVARLQVDLAAAREERDMLASEMDGWRDELTLAEGARDEAAEQAEKADRWNVELLDKIFQMYQAAGAIEGGDELEAVKRLASRAGQAEADSAALVSVLKIVEQMARDEMETADDICEVSVAEDWRRVVEKLEEVQKMPHPGAARMERMQKLEAVDKAAGDLLALMIENDSMGQPEYADTRCFTHEEFEPLRAARQAARRASV